MQTCSIYVTTMLPVTRYNSLTLAPQCTAFALYCIVPGKCPWALTAQVPKLRVGGYTKEVLEWSNYLRASAHPGCEDSCQGIPSKPASSLRLYIVQASLMVKTLYHARKWTDC